jgi:hypothetical protein
MCLLNRGPCAPPIAEVARRTLGAVKRPPPPSGRPRPGRPEAPGRRSGRHASAAGQVSRHHLCHWQQVDDLHAWNLTCSSTLAVGSSSSAPPAAVTAPANPHPQPLQRVPECPLHPGDASRDRGRVLPSTLDSPATSPDAALAELTAVGRARQWCRRRQAAGHPSTRAAPCGANQRIDVWARHAPTGHSHRPP